MATIKDTFEDRHRQNKRKAEMQIIMRGIMPFLKSMGNRRILEFGSGDGCHIPYLRRLGYFVASDIYKSDRICRDYPDVEFVKCDIKSTPFETGGFNVVFSNHVLEHIKDIKEAFSELKRIGSRECIYVFTVPTSTWLLLSIPAQCYNLLRRAIGREADSKALRREREKRQAAKGLRRFLPVGHGWRKDFFDCFTAFRIKNWHKLFCENGFEVMKMMPLLLYAPSEFPVIPTTGFLVNQGVCSNAMFVLKKKI